MLSAASSPVLLILWSGPANLHPARSGPSYDTLRPSTVPAFVCTRGASAECCPAGSGPLYGRICKLYGYAQAARFSGHKFAPPVRQFGPPRSGSSRPAGRPVGQGGVAGVFGPARRQARAHWPWRPASAGRWRARTGGGVPAWWPEDSGSGQSVGRASRKADAKRATPKEEARAHERQPNGNGNGNGNSDKNGNGDKTNIRIGVGIRK